MKINNKLRILLAVLLLSFTASAAEFKAGEDHTITETVTDNLYIAGNTINIDAIIKGDLIAAGNSITVNDTIYEDLTVAGADILINSEIGDDARLFGENIKVLRNINGDLIVFGSNLQIDRNVYIKGDLIIFAAQATVNGNVGGNVKFFGSELTLNGQVEGELETKADELIINGRVMGNSAIAADEITLGKSASFDGTVEYWQSEGEMDFSPYMTAGQARYNKELMFDEEDMKWEYFGLGIFAFWILYTLSVILALIVLVMLFSGIFARAGEQLNRSSLQNLGYGVIYFIGLPLLTVLLFLTIVGIPLGMVTLSLYGISLFFAYSITSIVIAEGINQKYGKNWGKWQIILIAALAFLCLKFITLIPFVGFLAVMIVIAMAFGALLYRLFLRNGEKREIPVS